MMRRTRRTWKAALGLVAGVLAASCSAGFKPPELTAVEPDWGYNGESTSIEVLGRRLYPNLVAGGADDIRLDRDVQAWLLTEPRTELEAVRMLDYERIAAEVPPGVSPGQYGVRVRTANGDTVELPDAFTVTDTRADRLSAEVDQVVFSVQQIAVVLIQVHNPQGVLVPTPMAIQVQASGTAANSGGLEFLEGTLNDQITTDGGMTGSLDANGQGYIAFTSSRPGDVRLDIRPGPNHDAVASASQLVTFAASEVDGLAIRLPEDGFSTTAGAPFNIDLELVDVLGNPVNGKAATVFLVESCTGGTLSTLTTFLDRTTIEVQATASTDLGACAGNQIVGAGVVEGAAFEGVSEVFSVQPGPVEHLDVFAAPTSVMAGEDVVNVTATAQDEWGNTVTDTEATVQLADDVGALSLENGNGTHTCGDFLHGTAVCAATLFRSGLGRQLLATVSAGVSGQSNTIHVLPGPATSIDVKVSTDGVDAGTPFDVGVQIKDAFGNPISLTTATFDSAQFFDEAGEVDCSLADLDDDATLASFQCVCTTAIEENTILVVVDDLAATGESNAFAVHPGPLSLVDFTLTEAETGSSLTSLVAGQDLNAALTGTDAWGNPAVGDEDIVVLDLVEGIPATTVTMSDGTATTTLQPIIATEGNTLVAVLDDTLIGVSGPFDVVPAAMVGVEVVPPQPWVWSGEETAFEIRPVDAFGNGVVAFSSTMTLSSQKDAGPSRSAVIDGPTIVSFLFDTLKWNDSLEVTDGTWTGNSSGFDVVTECADMPDVEVSLSGAELDALCLDDEGTADTTISITPGDLKRYHWVIDELAFRQGEATLEHTFQGAGRSTVHTLAAREDHCAVESSRQIYRNVPGEPAGVIEVLLSDGLLVAGTTGGDERTNASFTARDCSGDFASGGSIQVRANLGDLASTEDTTLTSTGTGLFLDLDSAGTGSVTWSMSEVHHDGEATLWAGTQDGGGYGARTVTVTGDSTPPILIDFDPSGSGVGDFSSMTLFFSEPMLTTLDETTVMESVTLLSPTGTPVIWNTMSWTSDGLELTLDLPTSRLLDEGAWTLLVNDELRDAAGNRIDGDYDGIGGGTLTVNLGAVPSEAPDTVGCAINTPRVRHDGDPGLGFEADQLEVSLETSADPAWWVLDVENTGGALVDHRRVDPVGSYSGSWQWDAISIDGFALENGIYTLYIYATDAAWNPGDPCIFSIAVDNHIGPLE